MIARNPRPKRILQSIPFNPRVSQRFSASPAIRVYSVPVSPGKYPSLDYPRHQRHPRFLELTADYADVTDRGIGEQEQEEESRADRGAQFAQFAVRRFIGSSRLSARHPEKRVVSLFMRLLRCSPGAISLYLYVHARCTVELAHGQG